MKCCFRISPYVAVLCAALFVANTSSAQIYPAVDGVTYETCSGTFHDSGGAAGNYGSNENIVTTLCPTGGAGSGPLTSVTFTQWSIAPGPGDILNIHDGTSDAGALLGTGSNASSLLGSTFTASGADGCLTFQWESDASGTAAGWSAQITTGPDAGRDTSIVVCTSAPPFNMRLRLAGTPEPGGSWTGPGGAPLASSQFDPATFPEGNYTYTVTGPAPCPDQSAILTITKVTARNPGTNASVTLCDTDDPEDLIDLLGGIPEGGGAWSGPDGPHADVFDPASDPPGAYVYTLTGSAPCPDASATVTIVVNEQPDAGEDAFVTVCSISGPFGLFGSLGGSPSVGGAWSGPDLSPVSATYTPGSSTPGTYTYTVVGQAPCTTSTATVEVTEVVAPDAGNNRSLTICSDLPAFAMVDELNGTPDGGGTWQGPNGPHGNTFDPGTDDEGAYTYTVSGDAPCTDDSAVLTLTVREAPNAGISSDITVCSNDGAFSLLDELAGSPDANGTWTNPGGVAHSGTFVPGTNLAGTYTYTVVGQAPCDPAVATVLVNVNPAPVAGGNASISVCSTDSEFPLIDVLNGTPDPDGTWTGPLGAHGDTFVPGTDVSGNYEYTVTGTVPCSNATALVAISVVNAPNAGVSVDIDVCGNDGAFSLFEQLGGTPAANGAWTVPSSGPGNGVFTPGTSEAGIYTYTVSGQGPCQAAQSTVDVNVVPPPNAGTNGSLSICSSDDPVDLFTLLGGNPEPGGTWVRPSGNPHDGIYQPGIQQGGIFVYTVNGDAPCANASSSVTVNRVIAPNAGSNAAITVCSTGSPFNMLSVLGGNPGGTGSWFGPAQDPVSGTFTPGTSGPGTYTYVITGVAPCANDSAQVTVTVNEAPDAGSNASITVCSSDDPFALIDLLGGSPDAGGTWQRPNGTPHSGTFIPGLASPGGYTYTVAGTAPCVNASAVVTVSVNQQPNAGNGTTVELCSTEPPVDLFASLGGSPNAGGTWSGPGGASTGVFFPGTDPPGNYVYTITGIAPCADATATIAISVNPAPNAGIADTITTCVDSDVVDLFDGLDGSPDAGGTWVDVSGTGQQAGQFFDPQGIAPGSYSFTYSVDGIGQCAADDATVVVTIVDALNAGTNGTLPVCSSNTQVNLFNGLGGTPQQGGTWIDVGSTGALNGQFFNAQQTGAGNYLFTYELTSDADCAAASANVTVTVSQAPNAGTSGNVTVCSNSPNFPLFPYLGGTPQSGPGTNWFFGSVNGTPFSGTYNTNIHVPGVYYYVVSGSSPCTNAVATVTVTEVLEPNSGADTSILVCETDPQFNMTPLLGGSPQPGNWSFNNVPHGPVFVPGLDSQGVYEYTVIGQAPCGSSSSFLTISVEPAADAGGSGSHTVCSDDPPFLLISVLGGSPQPNGSWFDPDTVPMTAPGIYTPGTSQPGPYTYVVTGGGPCVSDTSVVWIFENEAADAGTNTSINLCSVGNAVNLFNVLGGTPDQGGSWVGPAPGNPPFNGQFQPGVSTPGTYTYIVQGLAPCDPDSATVAVSISTSPSAGISNSITLCSNNNAFAMVDSLGGSPALNGSWEGPLPPLTPMNGIFIPGTTTPGTYRYRVPGVGACPSTTATLTVAVNTAPEAGNNNNATACSSDAPFDLFPLLGPSAQPGGTWTLQSGGGHSGTIDPAVDVSDTYIYTVTGLFPCPLTDVALVTVQIAPQPNAGFNNVITVCDSDDPFLLIAQLNGNPQSTNGSWSGPGPGGTTGIFLPQSSPGGIYTYTVTGLPCPAASATVTVIKHETPDAGGNAVIEVCSDQPQIDLFTQLTGTPDENGEWTDGNNNPFSGFYIPGQTPPGTFQYFLQGTAPCVSDSATVTVIEYSAPDAGITTIANICRSQGITPLVSLLGGTPDATGTWTFNGPHGPDIDPAIAVSGAYVYTVTGQAPCPNATAQVQVILVSAPNPGSSGSIAVCLDDPAIPLTAGLGGTPTSGGTWVNVSEEGVLSGSTWDATGVPPGSYQFTYTVTGATPCSDSTATVTVGVSATLDAGDDTSIAVCANELVDLFASLDGNPQAGGFWIDVDTSNALLVGDIFNAFVVGGGTTWQFDHVLPGSNQCPADTARLTITVLESPNAGCDGSIAPCSNAPPVNMASALCGPDANGTWFNTSTWSPASGTFLPASSPPGVYAYVVPGVGSCPADTAFVTMTVVAEANAGSNATVSICSTDQPLGLFPLLGPNAQAGGTWVCLSCSGQPSFSGTYNPTMNVPGNYQYTVVGAPPCSNDAAVVEVFEPLAADAGCNSVLPLCSSDDVVNMFSAMGCSPQPGGTWVGPDGPHGDTFDPATDSAGVYTYTVQGVAPCVADSATLTITVTQQFNAGVSATVGVCITQGTVDLFPLLGPLADPGGNWSGTAVLPTGIFNPVTAGIGVHQIIYSFPSSGTCAATSTTLTVNVGSGLSAGNDTSLTICGAITDFDLFEALGGNPDTGGSWQDLIGVGGLLAGGILDATQISADVTGQYGYIIVDPACGDVSAVVSITVRAYPDPGSGTSLVLCSTDAPVDLFAQLQGAPDANGTWSNPGGLAHTNIFDPAVDAPGAYEYTVPGNATCPDSSATVLLTVNLPPDAGSNGNLLVCDTLIALDLFTGLQGVPQTGGSWTDVDGSGALTDGQLNTTTLEQGDLTFIYTVDVPSCGTSSAEVVVQVVGSVEVSEPLRICNTVDRTYTVSFTVTGGDPGSVSVSGLDGTLVLGDPVLFTSTPIMTSAPFDVYITDQYACNMVRISGGSPCQFNDDVFVPQAFSPNNDNINDAFVIPGIEGFPDNTIIIFNRWGAKMYEGAGYDNSTVIWDGSSSDGTYNGVAPTGTYFYILDLGNGSEPLTGYIYLNR